jgi:hypothetical protein
LAKEREALICAEEMVDNEMLLVVEFGDFDMASAGPIGSGIAQPLLAVTGLLILLPPGRLILLAGIAQLLLAATGLLVMLLASRLTLLARV